jgi:potassium/chloride transporter 9
MTFFVMNLACFLLKIGSAPNFRPGFKFFTWQSALVGSILSASAMFFIDETYASIAVCLLIFLFLLIHYLSPPKHWGDVSQNLIYHQVRKYLLRLKPEHIKFWRPQIILLVNDPRKHIRLVQFCNSMKKGGLYILGHVIVTDDFGAGVQEAKTQQAAWTHYISEFSRIKAFVQLTMSPSITWGVRNLLLSSGLGGLRPNVAVLGFYNMDELRESQPVVEIPEMPTPQNTVKHEFPTTNSQAAGRARGDTTSRLVEGFLPTDVIRKEGRMNVTSYMTILEDLALRYKINVAVGKGFDSLQSPRSAEHNSKRYIDLWPIQMSAEVETEGKSVLTSNFDTYTLILQLGFILHSVPTWKKAYKLRVLVFVEYETEVKEEQKRAEALLEKLRIEAEVVVLWLASGDLATYEMVVQGRPLTPEIEVAVNQCLKDDDWWQELQTIRGRSQETTATQADPFITQQRRPEYGDGSQSTSAPHGGNHMQPCALQTTERRRASAAMPSDLKKKSTVSQLARLGINMGFRTQNLPLDVLDNGAAEESGESDSESDSYGSSLGDFNRAASGRDIDDVVPTEPILRPLLAQERGQGAPMTQPKGFRDGDLGHGTADRARGPSYGTMSSGPLKATMLTSNDTLPSHMTIASMDKSSEQLLQNTIRPDLRSLAHHGAASQESLPRSRHHSRHGSSAIRFSSNLTPETTITAENGSEPRIMFAQSEIASKPRPGLSRHASSSRVANKELPNQSPDGQGGPGRSVSFAEPVVETTASSRASLGDAHVDMSELLSSYPSNLARRNTGGSGSSYSTQGLTLSFNDLPSRAQHLVLNELLQQNSAETAVLFTTLPIPEEGTCQSEEASIQYLSDIEVLCNELPPVLLVLSNNMTVTVSL